MNYDKIQVPAEGGKIIYAGIWAPQCAGPSDYPVYRG